MTVDVEEYFQVGAFERCIRREDWGGYASRVAHNTGRVLDLFAQKGIRATFFSLGWVAERQPQLIRRIVEDGHELASHGYAHDRVTSFTASQFRADLERSKKLLEDAGGVAVRGYRAPSFSIGKANAWALDVLAELGYAYSSSVAPIRHDHYGWPDAPRFAYRPIADSPLIEVPITTVPVAGRTLSFGGGFFRLLPYGVARWAIGKINREEGQPAVFYFHPWEVDPEQPRVADAPMRSRFRHYTNLSRMYAKLDRLTDDFAWDRMDALFLPQVSSRPVAV
ncbi:MAG TPA: XrtA system polysaccharide deacetylase [Pedomonas sp.]|uniref:XrtA system polysaccharide deacetylase n=1 Tax=Pedomonas sp. TaxID=2976421 RepID=UPI002F41CB9F